MVERRAVAVSFLISHISVFIAAAVWAAPPLDGDAGGAEVSFPRIFCKGSRSLELRNKTAAPREKPE